MRTCELDGCESRYYARGACYYHYCRERAGLPPWPTEPLTKRQRFEKYLPDTRPLDACWDWQGAVHATGYGAIWWRDRMRYAHRVSWELHYGRIPVGSCVLHACDRPICCAPHHLWLGSSAENALDMWAKGRARDSGTYVCTDRIIRDFGLG